MVGTVEELLAGTVGALSTLDAEALEALAAEAERLARSPVSREELAGAGTASAHRTLGALMASTERSLRMLRGLRAAPGERSW